MSRYSSIVYLMPFPRRLDLYLVNVIGIYYDFEVMDYDRVVYVVVYASSDVLRSM